MGIVMRHLELMFHVKQYFWTFFTFVRNINSVVLYCRLYLPCLSNWQYKPPVCISTLKATNIIWNICLIHNTRNYMNTNFWVSLLDAFWLLNFLRLFYFWNSNFTKVLMIFTCCFLYTVSVIYCRGLIL